MSWFGFGGGKKDDSAGLGDSETSSTFDNFSGGGSSFEDPGTTFDNTASLGTSDRLENVAALACITHKTGWIMDQIHLLRPCIFRQQVPWSNIIGICAS